jgi:hypothetical protein
MMVGRARKGGEKVEPRGFGAVYQRGRKGGGELEEGASGNGGDLSSIFKDRAGCGRRYGELCDAGQGVKGTQGGRGARVLGPWA